MSPENSEISRPEQSSLVPWNILHQLAESKPGWDIRENRIATEPPKLIEEYVNNTDSITASQADKTATAALTKSINLSKLNLEYYQKMRTAAGAVKTAKFMQLEAYLRT